MPEVSAADWNEFIAARTGAHILQSPRWGDLKAAFGWETCRIISGGDGIQILFRRLGPGLRLGYVPRGPAGEAWARLQADADRACRARGAIFLKSEPDQWESPGMPPAPEGFRPSSHGIQPARTLLVDLRGEEEEILARMKQKTRYNIRLAGRKGVRVRVWDDLAAFHRMMVETGARDHFGVHSRAYYELAYRLFHPQGECELFLAEYEGEALGAVMVFAFGERAWYFYGASTERHRNRMPNYLLQWEAMRWARDRGCREYDLWGVPDRDEQALEDSFLERSDGLWSVYRFKRGFGGELKRAAGPWDRVYRPALYQLYRWWTRGRLHD